MAKSKSFMVILMFFGLLVMPMTGTAKSETVGTVTKNGTTIVRSPSNPVPKPVTPAKKNVVKKTDTKKKSATTKKVEKTPAVEASTDAADDTSVTPDQSTNEQADTNLSTTGAPANLTAANLEKQVIDSMLKNDFPEKSEFIADEDKKTGVVLGKSDILATKAGVPKLKETDGLGGMLLSTVVMTIVLAALIIGMAYVWRYLQSKSFGKMLGKSGNLKVISEQVITPKSKLMVIDCYGKKYLLGTTENNIQMLADIDLDAVVEAESSTDDGEVVPDDLSDDQPQQKSVAGIAKNILSQFAAKKEVHPSSAPGKMFVPLSQISDVEIKRNMDVRSVTPVKTLKTSERIKERLKDMKRLA